SPGCAPSCSPDAASGSRSGVEQLLEDVELDGLQEVRVEAFLLRAPPVLVLAVAGDGDEARVAERRLRAEPARRLVAVAAGEPDVEEHDVGPELGGDGDGGVAGVGDAHPMAGGLEQDLEAERGVDV